MAKIIEEGKIPEPIKPWWFTSEFKCPHCNTRYELEEEDFTAKAAAPIDPNAPAGWTVTTEKCLNGRQWIDGPCPYCKRPNHWERMPTSLAGAMNTGMLLDASAGKEAARVRYENMRASLPNEIRGWRWVKRSTTGTAGRLSMVTEVAALPIGPNGPIFMQFLLPDKLFHCVRRLDGQMMTDGGIPADMIGVEWNGITEADASLIDAELVEFVNRLGLVDTTAPKAVR